MIGDRGMWLHRAVFLPDVAVEMSCLSLAQPRAGTVMGPVFYSEKKKRAMGASAGGQLVCVQGARPAHARAPHPAKDKPVAYDSRINLGMAFDGKVLSGFRESKKFADSKEAPRLCEGIDTGRAALAWNGSVQALLFSVRIEGKLDPDWIARELGEKGAAAKEDSAKK